MIRPGRAASVLVLALLLASLLPASAPAAEARDARQVVIVLAPYLTWDDIRSDAMPVTRSLAERSTIGNINVRSSARFSRNPSQTHIALTMSAGSPAAFDLAAPAAHDVGQRLEMGTAGEAYQRSMGQAPGDAAIAYLGLARILRANSLGTLPTVPGILGQTIAEAGGATAAVGNSDGGYAEGNVYRSRPAAVLAMDAHGLVRFGDVSTTLLMDSGESPYGVSTDMATFEAAYRDAITRLGVHGGPGLLVLDPGDPERAFNFTADASLDAAEKHRRAAAASVDRVVQVALDGLPEDGVLMLVSSGQVRPSRGPSGFGPIIIAGDGYDGGLVSSPSTHRKGLMTDLDVSATVLGILGLERPVEVLGNAVTPGWRDESAEGRYAFLQELNATAVAVDTVRPMVQNSYIVITVIVLLACAALLRPMQRSLSAWGGPLAKALGYLILLLLSMPVSATLMYLFELRPDSAASVAGLFALTTALVFAAVALVSHRWGSPTALAVIGLVTALVLIVDQLAGARLSFSGMFSYSPLLGARYYGIGNEGASILVGGGLVGMAMLLDAFAGRPWARPVRRFGPIVLGALVVIVSAAPFLGANVGVVAWGTVAFGILWMHLNGHHFTWKTVLALFGLIVLTVAAFSAYEVFSGADQTHLGRAWESAGTGGVGELWLIVARKAETNWRVLRATNWSILMIAILAVLGVMRWRPHGVFAETLRAYPAFAVAMTASLWGSVAGYFTEDSGIVIPALVMLFITGSLLHVMLWRLGAVREASDT